ncbi:hypothetical protein OSB04_025860 [Centaurea solstitialis]|uniref:Protein kinase domain-containing protein n=1 Tax=Centaurea solstitialis TaxID=347529 RepID=A0AA38SWE3_9ASTR|nr:hypothetical protein OSB04_025860 [Centaurea solstitialis]
MGDSSSVDGILEFLRSNKFARAEAALRSEIGNRGELNGFMQGLKLGEKEIEAKVVEEKGVAKSGVSGYQGKGSQVSDEALKEELIVKEIEYGTASNGSASKWKNVALVEGQNTAGEPIGTRDKKYMVSNNSEEMVRKFSSSNGSVDVYQNDASTRTDDVKEYEIPSQSKIHPTEVADIYRVSVKVGAETDSSAGRKQSLPGSTFKASLVPKQQSMDKVMEPKEINCQNQVTGTIPRDNFMDNPWSRNDELKYSSSELWKDRSIKTVFPFPKGDASTSYDTDCGVAEKEDGIRRPDINVRATIKEQVDEVGRALYLATTQGNNEADAFGGLGFPVISQKQKEELPRLPPVKLKSDDKPLSITWEEKYQRDGPGSNTITADSSYLIGSFLDVPIGQELSSAGAKRLAGGNWFSVSQGIAEDTSDLVSGFATIGDGLSESVDYPNEYWDSDEYDDDDDVGYMRQPIEDETWFLAHEIDYPSDNEKRTGHGNSQDPQERGPEKNEDDDQSFAEDDSYLSGDQYFQSKNVDPDAHLDGAIVLSTADMYSQDDHDIVAQYDGQLMDAEELNLMRSEPVWKGFVSQTNELIMLGEGQVLDKTGRPHLDDLCIDEDQHGSVRSIGVGINSDVADFGSEVRESLVGGSSEGDLEYFRDNDVSMSPHDSEKKYVDRAMREKTRKPTSDNDKPRSSGVITKNVSGSGFSFPPPRDGQSITNKAFWVNKENAIVSVETASQLHTLTGNDDLLPPWRRKSSSSSPVKSSRDEEDADVVGSGNSSPSTLSNYNYAERARLSKEEDEKVIGSREEDPGASLEDEEAAAVQEQVKQIKAQEEDYETFNLKIVHRKNRTGFEEDKNFHVVLNSVIAGRYHVTEYLGSAAFSKAIQAHDLHTGMDVCVKIIKNNKDFFDQSLDEIKLLKFINKHDPGDKYHLLRLYDYFYYREHLLIVCELLKANLYEFHKFNRESGGEVYFTMPRLQSITIQCLEALQFLHGLGLIHCDLKPENILVKSYSRCEVKVIDLGSSCFESDHLCSYVQSRSYRAPEVILGLPYDKKIDIWSLGCILAELCTGNVLFQNDSPATLLARVIGIISPIGQDMLAKGRDTYKYFSKNHMLYERNQDTNRLEYLIPKKTSLRHRLPMGDQGFIDFVSHLLEINPKKRPSATEALKHPWLSYPYEPISS